MALGGRGRSSCATTNSPRCAGTAVRVLRSVRAVVRSPDWATATLTVDRIRDTGTTLSLHVRSAGFGSSFAGVVRVEARASALRVTCDLESESAFQTNRTGLVVLHPHQVAGGELVVTHSDGAVEQTRFPSAISPHQPVFDIVGLSWRDDGLDISATFDGDVFEMEDQRNWSDASFKTYSRPLGLPFPYSIEPGERVIQSVTITVTEARAAGGGCCRRSHRAAARRIVPADPDRRGDRARSRADVQPDRRRGADRARSGIVQLARRPHSRGGERTAAGCPCDLAADASGSTTRRSRRGTAWPRHPAGRGFRSTAACHGCREPPPPSAPALSAAGIDCARRRRRPIAFHRVQPRACADRRRISTGS